MSRCQDIAIFGKKVIFSLLPDSHLLPFMIINLISSAIIIASYPNFFLSIWSTLISSSTTMIVFHVKCNHEMKNDSELPSKKSQFKVFKNTLIESSSKFLIKLRISKSLYLYFLEYVNFYYKKSAKKSTKAFFSYC